jgi:NAD(P)-dependent dehydrogenase (short-subunit alcohol dehydrogenase family)
MPSDVLPTATALLKDRIILITGANRGIGETAALHCAKAGATVILLGRNSQQLEAVYDRIEAAGGPQPALFVCDLAKARAEDIQALAQSLEAEFGRLDGLLHNAALLGLPTSIEQYAPDTWAQVMQVNLNAPFLLTRYLLPLLRKSTAGQILFTSSSLGRKGRGYWGAYGASKAALENLMQTLADELEHTSVRINSINPGGTRTAMRASAYPAEDPLSVKPAEDLMPSYLQLLSEHNRQHGQQLSYP